MNFNKIKSKLQFLTTFILMFVMLGLFSTECSAKPRYQVGNLIEFGSYYQDDLTQQTPIKWLVLDIKDGKALLISELLLDVKPYHYKKEAITWENSSIRRWLNNEFINKAFNSQEKSRIILTLLDNWDNPKYGTNAGNDTKDKVFLLSLDEVQKYLPNQNQRAIATTEYTQKQGAIICKEAYCGERGFYGNGWWWLRSPGYYQDSAAVVLINGAVIDNGRLVHSHHYAVRPALWINL